MIIQPKIRQFICTTAHPIGCAESVRRQIDVVQAGGSFDGPKRALIIGCSTGYGLASRIALAFGAGTETIGISFEREPNERRTASAGWYNNRAFDEEAAKAGLQSRTLDGDAFSAEMKRDVCALLRDSGGAVDLVVYSLAAPRRTDADGVTWRSAIKPIGETYHSKSLNLTDNTVGEIDIEPATDEEIEGTVKVMGGEDWALWIDALAKNGLLNDGAKTLAYTYIGPELTHGIYTNGTIGRAKQHLFETANQLSERYQAINLDAALSVNKAVVTQASAAIPCVSLYVALLFRVMKDAGTHEGCIEQMDRLFRSKIAEPRDEQGLIRMDDWEMAPDIQRDVTQRWQGVTSDNIRQLGDLDGYWLDYYQLFGFRIPGVDYDADIPTS